MTISGQLASSGQVRRLVLSALAAFGVLLGAALPASASTTYAYDAPVHVYDGAAHSVQAPTGEAAPVVSQEGSEGLQGSLVTVTGLLSVVWPLSVAADSASGGYSSFARAKTALGSPGEGNVYDHVVEQSQIGRSGFTPEQIHNPANLNPVSAQVNQLKANYYSSIQPGTEGMTVRNWLNGQSFADQYAYGMRVTQQILDTLGGAA